MSATPVRILLVEDSPSDAQLLVELLESAEPGRFQFICAETLAQAFEVLQGGQFDMLLLELTLPDSVGRGTFVRARAQAPGLPIVVLTGVGDEAIGLEAVRHGVQDYLIKGQADGRQIARAIGYAIERKRAEAELQRARNELELRVAERTADLNQTVEILRTEIRYRKEVEQALRESEERYRTLFEFAPVGIAISTYGGRVLAFNWRLCEMAGITSAEALKTRAAAFYAHPGDRRRLMAEMRKTGKVELHEVWLKRKDGSTFQGLVHMNDLRLGNQRLVMTMVQDITQQKRIERRADGVRHLLELFVTRTSRQEYVESVVKLLREWCDCQCAGIRLLDGQGRIPYVTSAGYSRAFLKQESRLCLDREDCICIRIFKGHSRAQDLQFTSRQGSFFCNSASRFAQNLSATEADCAKVPCLAAGYESLAHAPIRYGGQLLGTIHLADRRTHRFPAETMLFIETVAPLIGEAIHRFQVEESLLESEQRFRSMFERNEAIMLLVNPESGAIEDANPAAAIFYGYSREGLRERTIQDLNVQPLRIGSDQGRSALGAAQSSNVFPHRAAGGEIRTVEVHSSPVRVGGQLLNFSIIHDVTERQQLEKQMLDIAEAERQRVGQDLHDSLGGILTGAALMSKALAQKLAARAMPEAGVAEEVMRCMNDAIAQARAISHGLYPVELGSGGLVSGLSDFAVGTAKRFGIACQLHADKSVAIADPSISAQLFRIVQEAVTNAIRHGKAGHIDIRLGRRGDRIVLEICDDGRGMPAQIPAGRGMGLRTMKYRADLIGAHFAVTASEKAGTLVTCLLPVSVG